MADVPVGEVPAPAPEAPPAVHPVIAAREARAAKLANVAAGLAKLNTSDAPAPAEKPVEKPAEPTEETPSEETEEPAAAAPVEPAETPADDPPPDPQTAKALAAIDKQAARFRAEQAKAKREFDQEMADARADIARQKQEIAGKFSSLEDLQKLAKKDPISLLRKFGIDSEDDWERVGRGAYPHTKAGKADPRAAEAVNRSEKEHGRDSEIAELRELVSSLKTQIETDKKKAESQSYVESWQADAVKAIPADKPTLIAKLHAKSPAKAKQALLKIGAELERDNDGETPSYADVIAEYEKRERAELEDRGVDVDALLKGAPAKPAVEQKSATPTLDLGAPKNGVRPINGSPTREQKLAAITAGLKRLNAEST